MPRLAYLVVIVAALCPVAASAQTPPPEEKRVALFNGLDLKGWRVEHAKARVRDSVIRVEKSRGWVRTETPFADFILTLEVRVGPNGGKAGLFVRGWPVFDKDERPASAFHLSKAFPEFPSSDTAGAWERWEIECVGQKLQLRVNGAAAYSVDTLKNPQGYVGLWADTNAEFRSIELRLLNPPRPAAGAGVLLASTPGVTIPRVVKEVKPAYTLAAMERRIQGTVWIQGVVEITGSFGRMSIQRSLDPDYGLDAAAIAAAEQWQFEPATLDGKPVAVFITIELAFMLRPR
jgi:TonB family protein